MKRIFMLSSHPLLGQGVESLLRRETGLEIVGREMDVDKAVERIKELRPDAVILDCAEPKCDPTPAVIRILGEGLGTKVIGLNLQNNTMCIYRGEQRVVRCTEDLIEAIEHSLLLPAPVSSEDLAKVGGERKEMVPDREQSKSLSGESPPHSPKKENGGSSTEA